MSRHEGRAEQSGAGQPPPSTPALVTGATSGLGRSLAQALADRGWTVLVHGRDEGRCAEVVGELRAAGGTAYPYLADLSSSRRPPSSAGGWPPSIPRWGCS